MLFLFFLSFSSDFYSFNYSQNLSDGPHGKVQVRLACTSQGEKIVVLTDRLSSTLHVFNSSNQLLFEKSFAGVGSATDLLGSTGKTIIVYFQAPNTGSDVYDKNIYFFDLKGDEIYHMNTDLSFLASKDKRAFLLTDKVFEGSANKFEFRDPDNGAMQWSINPSENQVPTSHFLVPNPSEIIRTKGYTIFKQNRNHGDLWKINNLGAMSDQLYFISDDFIGVYFGEFSRPNQQSSVLEELTLINHNTGVQVGESIKVQENFGTFTLEPWGIDYSTLPNLSLTNAQKIGNDLVFRLGTSQKLVISNITWDNPETFTKYSNWEITTGPGFPEGRSINNSYVIPGENWGVELSGGLATFFSF